jgi:hypothetical protein
MAHFGLSSRLVVFLEALSVTIIREVSNLQIRRCDFLDTRRKQTLFIGDSDIVVGALYHSVY